MPKSTSHGMGLNHVASLTFAILFAGRVTSLVSKKDQLLATRIEEAIKKNESLESLSASNVRRDVARTRITEQKDKKAKLVKVSNQKSKSKTTSVKKAPVVKASTPSKSVKVSKPSKASGDYKKRKAGVKSVAVKSPSSKISVVGFRGKSSSDKRGSMV